jgi:hypothetical protein
VFTVVTGLTTEAFGQASSDSTPPDRLLLKDHRPQSIFKIPQTRVEKARYPVIDVHSHAYAKTEAQVDKWVQTMDAVGIEKTVLLTGATGKAFDETTARFKRYPGRFEMWCGIDYASFDQPDFGPVVIAELERCHRAGAKGVGEMIENGWERTAGCMSLWIGPMTAS